MRYLFAVVNSLWSTCANAEQRLFLCEDPDIDHEAFKFILSIDLENKTMSRSSDAWAEEVTIVFEDRYIMSAGLNTMGNIGGNLVIFDRYTGELVMGGTSVRDLTINKNGYAVTPSVWQCTEKKI